MPGKRLRPLGWGLIAALSLLSCVVMPSGSPSSSPVASALPTAPPQPSPTFVDPDVAELLSTLPDEAGGVFFEDIQSVDDAFLSGHPVDDVLAALGKTRAETIAVFRSGANGTIGAISVDGTGGQLLLEAFAQSWHAPAVVGRFTRILGGTVAWELVERDGARTVLYQRQNLVYLATAPDRAAVERILSDMPQPLP